MNGPFLIRIDEAKFADIPNKVVPRTVRLKDPSFETHEARNWIFGGYCEMLLYKNEKLQHLLLQFVSRLDDSDCWNQLTQGQRILYPLAAMDGQVKNGGMVQFLWNCPDLICPASDALTALGYSELAAAYEKSLECLFGKKGKWLELRKQSSSDPAIFWEPFQATYDLLDLNWFDNAYFKQYGPTLIDLLMRYVRENKAEFIEL
jgi:hypothetical protein